MSEAESIRITTEINMVPEVQLEQEERTFHNTDSAYILPNDNIEHQRLDYQHKMLRRMMENKIFHAPLQKQVVRKVVDIGCGTGAVTEEMASIFPEAQIYGVDLSPIPAVRTKSPNVEYIQGDIMTLDDTRFQPESFDYIFSRLLVLGMSDWKGYIERCVALAKPGAWVEMHDVSHRILHIPPPHSSLTHLRPHTLTPDQLATKTHPVDAYYHAVPYLWEEIFNKILALKGMDTHAGEHLAQWFCDAGLQEVSITRYMGPCGRWDDLTEFEKEMAGYFEFFGKNVMPLAIRKAGEKVGPEWKEQVEDAIRDAEKFAAERERSRKFTWMYVVRGRKAE